MKISELFDIKYGINMELSNCEIIDNSEVGINFVSRTSENNGVVARVKEVVGKKPQQAGLITCAAGGSVLSAFVQKKTFYSGRDLFVLIPKKEMSLEEKLFYCHVIKMNAYRYQYGRQANKTLKNIELPQLPNWLKSYKIDYNRILTKVEKKELSLDVFNWKEFRIGELFLIKNGIKYPAEVREKGAFPLVSTSANNNGITDYVINRNGLYKNLLTVAYSGSVGATFYHEDDVFVGETVFALLPKFILNKEIGMFLSTILTYHNQKYNYGRKIVGSKYINDIIKLPADKKGSPDWKYMENYIKSLSYSDLI
ncbi:MAG: restriction endonuclease subunit S [Alphaproteobacteria bacterium]